MAVVFTFGDGRGREERRREENLCVEGVMCTVL